MLGFVKQSKKDNTELRKIFEWYKVATAPANTSLGKEYTLIKNPAPKKQNGTLAEKQSKKLDKNRDLDR